MQYKYPMNPKVYWAPLDLPGTEQCNCSTLMGPVPSSVSWCDLDHRILEWFRLEGTLKTVFKANCSKRNDFAFADLVGWSQPGFHPLTGHSLQSWTK